jgi:uncharacterized protein YdaU (DUF1376 family)
VNYYERHLGDYAKDAGHLSMLEHGAYSLLLDRYYTTEQPIPQGQAYRICRARTRDERAAVDTVLAEFFVLIDGAWTNGRADREITKMQAKVKAAQENGKRGGRPKRTKEEPSENPVGSDWVTQTKAHQSPDTRLHKESASALSAREVTPAGAVGIALKAAGIDPLTINLSDPVITELIAQGATPDEFAGLAREAVASGKRNPMKWVLAVLPERRKDAASVRLAPPGRQGTGNTGPEWARQRDAAVAAYAGPFAAKPVQASITEEVVDVTARRVG